LRYKDIVSQPELLYTITGKVDRVWMALEHVMRKTRTVVLYGNSLVVSGIAASLEGQPHLTVRQVDAPEPDLARLLQSLDPDVLTFDLAADEPDCAVTLLKTNPHLLLIGIDLSSGQMCLCSGQQSRALTIQDLVEAIDALPG